jgi:hypothetical protein
MLHREAGVLLLAGGAPREQRGLLVSFSGKVDQLDREGGARGLEPEAGLVRRLDLPVARVEGERVAGAPQVDRRVGVRVGELQGTGGVRRRGDVNVSVPADKAWRGRPRDGSAASLSEEISGRR